MTRGALMRDDGRQAIQPAGRVERRAGVEDPPADVAAPARAGRALGGPLDDLEQSVSEAYGFSARIIAADRGDLGAAIEVPASVA